jgi:hypothetical protein
MPCAAILHAGVTSVRVADLRPQVVGDVWLIGAPCTTQNDVPHLSRPYAVAIINWKRSSHSLL